MRTRKPAIEFDGVLLTLDEDKLVFSGKDSSIVEKANRILAYSKTRSEHEHEYIPDLASYLLTQVARQMGAKVIRMPKLEPLDPNADYDR